MKVLAVILLNLATVVSALVVYDQVRRAPPPPSVVAANDAAEIAALAERIEALEDEQGVSLGGTGVDPRLLGRLRALEEAVSLSGTPEERPDAVPRARNAESPPVAADPIDGASSPAEAAGPTRDDIRRWRRLRQAVQREDHLRRNRARFDQALTELPFSLTPEQRSKVYEAHARFEPRIGKIWGEIRAQAYETLAAGGTIDRQGLAAQGKAQVQQEFAEAISDIVHAADAEAVAKAMLPADR